VNETRSSACYVLVPTPVSDWPLCEGPLHRRRRSVNFVRQDIFARKYISKQASKQLHLIKRVSNAHRMTIVHNTKYNIRKIGLHKKYTQSRDIYI